MVFSLIQYVYSSENYLNWKVRVTYNKLLCLIYIHLDYLSLDNYDNNIGCCGCQKVNAYNETVKMYENSDIYKAAMAVRFINTTGDEMAVLQNQLNISEFITITIANFINIYYYIRISPVLFSLNITYIFFMQGPYFKGS